MRRRDFIKVVAGSTIAGPLAAHAQQPARMRRIGILWGASASDLEFRRRVEAFKQGLRSFGWTNAEITFELRSADGKLDRLSKLAAELVNANVDVIVTNGTPPAVAAQKATRTIPIVMAAVGDAIGVGLVSSLARPGGNVTGLTLVATEQVTKRLELIKETLPDLVRVAAFWNSNNASLRLQQKELQVVAPRLGLQFESIPITNAGQLEAAFDAALQVGAQAIITLEDPLILFLREPIIDLAMRRKVPVMGEFSPMCRAGALVSYAPDLVDMWRTAARYVDKILKGANPAELPIEQPTKFELLINLKTAKALGLEVPHNLLVLADEVIE